MNWINLKAAIAAAIKTNNNQEITGAILQNTLNSIVNSVGANATLAGVAQPDTLPGNPDGPVFWIAGQAGRYPNFGNADVKNDGITLFINTDGTWNSANIPIAGSGGSGEITDGAVTESKINNGAVTESKISNGAVTESKISNGAVTESKISNGAISENKMKFNFIQLLPIRFWFYENSYGQKGDERSMYGQNDDIYHAPLVEILSNDNNAYGAFIGDIAAYYSAEGPRTPSEDKMLYYNGTTWVELDNYIDYTYFYRGVIYDYKNGYNSLRGHFSINGNGLEVLNFLTNYINLKYGGDSSDFSSFSAFVSAEDDKIGRRVVVGTGATSYENKANIQKFSASEFKVNNAVKINTSTGLIIKRPQDNTTFINATGSDDSITFGTYDNPIQIMGNPLVLKTRFTNSSDDLCGFSVATFKQYLTEIRSRYRVKIANHEENADGTIDIHGSRKISLALSNSRTGDTPLVDLMRSGTIRLRYNEGHQQKLAIQDENKEDFEFKMLQGNQGDDYLYIEGNNTERGKRIFLHTPSVINFTNIININGFKGGDIKIHSNGYNIITNQYIRTEKARRSVYIYLDESRLLQNLHDITHNFGSEIKFNIRLFVKGGQGLTVYFQAYDYITEKGEKGDSNYVPLATYMESEHEEYPSVLHCYDYNITCCCKDGQVFYTIERKDETGFYSAEPLEDIFSPDY